MQPSGPQTPFETFCPNCRVTFPVGTRRCVHCGGRTGATHVVADRAAPPALEEQDDEAVGRRRTFSPMTGIWILLALSGAVYRTCSG